MGGEGSKIKKKHIKSKPLSQATRRKKKTKKNKKRQKKKIKTLNAEQQKKQKLEKRQRETSRMGNNRYHLLVFSRGCLLF